MSPLRAIRVSCGTGSIVVFTGILPVVQDDEHLAAVLGSPLAPRAAEPNPSLSTAVTVNGQTFVNKVGIAP